MRRITLRSCSGGWPSMIQNRAGRVAGNGRPGPMKPSGSLWLRRPVSGSRRDAKDTARLVMAGTPRGAPRQPLAQFRVWLQAPAAAPARPARAGFAR